MARKPWSLCRRLLQATSFLFVGAGLAPLPAVADDGASNDRITGAAPELLAAAAAFPARGAAAPTGVTVILSVSVNKADRGLAPFQLVGDDLWATRATLTDIGLRVATGADQLPGAGLVKLSQAFGADAVQYDAAMQSLAIMAAPGKLAVGTRQLNPLTQDRAVVASSTGALLNYDVYVNHAGGAFSLNGFTEARIFSGAAMLTNTAMVMATQGTGEQSGWKSQIVRLDTGFAYSLPDKRLTFRVGDTLTRATSWSRPTRIGGLRVGTDFALQPYMVTTPIPSFFGEATLPSTVDLYINGVKQYSGEAGPGPFEVGAGLTRLNGAGAAQLVVTDVLGQVTTLNYPLYDTPTLLRKGLTDWSVELGKVRENYGAASFDYGKRMVASASLRTGVTNRLTIEAHGEIERSLINAGLGGTVLLPFGGTLTGSVAASTSKGRTGHRAEIGFGWMDSRFFLSASAQRASKHYADIADRYGSPVVTAREIATVGYNTGKFGAFSASYVNQRQIDKPRFSYASVNWNAQVSRRLAFNASASQALAGRRETSVFFTLSFTPDNRDYFTAGVQTSDDRTSASFGYRRSLPSEGGVGWAADAVVDDRYVQASAQVDVLGSHGQLTAGARSVGRHQSGYLGFSGAVVAMGGGVKMSRKIFDGFALVSTGVADVPVLVHNRAFGRTGGDGKLLVTGLNPYENNRISIDPSALPAQYSVTRIEDRAVPSAGAGVNVRFDVRTIRSALMTLVDFGGAPLPVGARGYFVSQPDQTFYVGYDGQAFIDDAIAGGALVFEYDGKRCSVRMPATLNPENAGQLGRMACLEMTR